MPAAPSDLSLDLAIGPQIKADEHINNYTAIQAAVNALIAIVNGGAIGDVLTVGGSGPDWSSITPAATVPTGAVSPYAAAAAPTGWLLCDGAAVSRTTFSALFGVISTTYGVGDGSTTFNVPDLRGRLAVGVNTGGPTEINALAKSDGRAQALRNIFHRHTWKRGNGASVGGAFGNFASFDSASTDVAVTGDANNADSPAFLAVQFIIKT